MALARVGSGTGGFLLVQTAIALLTFLLAALVGMQFPLAGRVVVSTVSADSQQPTEKSAETADTTIASRLYTADFVGACLGALLPSTLLIPLIGVPAVCLLIAALNAVAGFVVLRSSRR